jgi:hypothetical protein
MASTWNAEDGRRGAESHTMAAGERDIWLAEHDLWRIQWWREAGRPCCELRTENQVTLQ